MLKQMRAEDPMLQAFQGALRKADYSKGTQKSYLWQAKSFMEWCDSRDIKPKTATQGDLKKYLVEINTQVEKKQKSWSNFLQACASLEILYHQVIHDAKRARFIPQLRKKITN